MPSCGSTWARACCVDPVSGRPGQCWKPDRRDRVPPLQPALFAVEYALGADVGSRGELRPSVVPGPASVGEYVAACVEAGAVFSPCGRRRETDRRTSEADAGTSASGGATAAAGAGRLRTGPGRDYARGRGRSSINAADNGPGQRRSRLPGLPATWRELRRGALDRDDAKSERKAAQRALTHFIPRCSIRCWTRSSGKLAPCASASRAFR